MMSDGKEDVLTSERSLWVDKYSPRHFTELLSDDVRWHGLYIGLILICVLLSGDEQSIAVVAETVG